METIRSADDLRIFLAVAQTGRLVAAAAQLGLDHTTIGRRINALERQTGRRLFDRTSAGWQLTPDGERLLEPAERVDAALLDARDIAAGAEADVLTGTIRILATDGFGGFILAPALAGLHRQHRQLTVELVTETQHISSTVRDFDVAVTLEQPTSSGVVHRRLTDYVLKLYATPDYLAAHPAVSSTRDLAQHTLIWYVDRLLDLEPLRLLHEVRDTAADIQSTNLVAHWQAAAAGAGVALLPHYIGATDPRLQCVLPDFEVFRTYWVSARRELAASARVRTVIALLDRVVAARSRDLLGAAG